MFSIFSWFFFFFAIYMSPLEKCLFRSAYLFIYFDIELQELFEYVPGLFYFLTLQYCIDFVIYQHESATGIHVFPILNPPSPPSPYHPSGSSQCTSPKHPVSCIEPGLVIRFIWYYTCFMFQCHYPKSSHPLPPPQSPKDCSIHQCLFCCLVYRVIVTIFLNSIYMH